MLSRLLQRCHVWISAQGSVVHPVDLIEKRLRVSILSSSAALKRPSENTDRLCNYPKPVVITSLYHLTATVAYPRTTSVDFSQRFENNSAED